MPAVLELIVMLPNDPEPAAKKVVKVFVVDDGKVTVLGALMMKVLNVLAPVNITAPVPLPVILRLLYVNPPPAKVLAVELVSVKAIVEVF